MTSREVMSRRTGRSGRHPQHVERGAAVRVGELPHPLLALHVDVHGAGRRLGGLHELRIADGEPEQEEGQRHADEDRLVPVPGLDLGGGLARPGAAGSGS